MKPEEWGDTSMKCFGILMDGRALWIGGEDVPLLIVMNGYHDFVRFTLPKTVGGSGWQLLIDTNLPEDSERWAFAPGEVYGVTGRSLLLFAFEADALEEMAD
jgi:glycogen operon protein